MYIHTLFVFSVQISSKAWKSSIGGHRFYHLIKTLLRIKVDAINNIHPDCHAHIRDLCLLSHTKTSSFLILCSLFLSKAHLENTLALASFAQWTERQPRD